MPDPDVDHGSLDLGAGGLPVRRVTAPDPHPPERAARAAAGRGLLADVGRALVAARELEPTLAQVARLALPVLGDFCAIDLVPDAVEAPRTGAIAPRADGQPRARRVASAHVLPAKEALMRVYAARFAPGDANRVSPAARVVASGEPLLLPVVSEATVTALPDPEQQALVRAVAPRSMLAVPLVARGVVLGALTFGVTESARRFDDEDVGVAHAFAERAALAIDNAGRWMAEQRARADAEAAYIQAEAAYADTRRALDAARLAGDRLAELQALTAALAGVLTAEQVGALVADRVRPLLRASLALVVAVADDDALTLLRASTVDPGIAESWARYPLALEGPMAEAVRSRAPVVVSTRAALDARFPARRDLFARWGAEAFLALPLVAHDAVIGALGLVWTAPQPFPPDTVTFVQAVADQCAQALARARLLEAERAARREAEGAQQRAEAAAQRTAQAFAETQALSASLERVNQELVTVAAAAAAGSRVKRDFLAVMSHELRTPLTAIGGYAELLQEGIYGAVTAEQHAQLDRVRHNQQHLLRIIDGMLALTRTEAGDLPLHPEVVPLARVLAAVESEVVRAARAKTLTLTVDLDACDVPVRVDAAKLRQVVRDLLDNAIKFTPAGGAVRLACETDPSTVRIAVADTGPGVAPEQHEPIFAPFQQADMRLSRAHGGTGLGLALGRAFVRRMGGELTVASAPGAGATFTITLPRADGAAGAASVDGAGVVVPRSPAG